MLYLGGGATLGGPQPCQASLLRPGLGSRPRPPKGGGREVVAIAGLRHKGLPQPVLRAAGCLEGHPGGRTSCCGSHSERGRCGRPSAPVALSPPAANPLSPQPAAPKRAEELPVSPPPGPARRTACRRDGGWARPAGLTWFVTQSRSWKSDRLALCPRGGKGALLAKTAVTATPGPPRETRTHGGPGTSPGALPTPGPPPASSSARGRNSRARFKARRPCVTPKAPGGPVADVAPVPWPPVPWPSHGEECVFGARALCPSASLSLVSFSVWLSPEQRGGASHRQAPHRCWIGVWHRAATAGHAS